MQPYEYAIAEFLYLLSVEEDEDWFSEDIMDFPEVRGEMTEYEPYEYDTVPAKIKENEGWE